MDHGDNTDLIQLNLSNKAYNGLLRNGIDSIDMLISCSDESIVSLKYVGRLALDEIITKKKMIVEFGLDVCLAANWQLGEKGNIQYTESELDFMAKQSFDELHLSMRSLNVLRRNGIANLKDLILLDSSKLREFKNLGAKSEAEIVGAKDKWINQYFSDDTIATKTDESDIPEDCATFFCNLSEEFEPFINVSGQVLYIELNKILIEANVEISNETVLREKEYLLIISECSLLNTALNRYIIAMMDPETNTVLIDVLNSRITKAFKKEHLINAIIHYSEDKYIIKKSNYFILPQISLSEYILAIDNDKAKEMIELKLSGRTLQEVGEEKGITRERVRQIIAKWLGRKTPFLYEDYYYEVFKLGKMEKQMFYAIFPDASTMAYEYLTIKYGNKGDDITLNILEEYDGLFREEVQKYLDCTKKRTWLRKQTKISVAFKVLTMHAGEYLSKEQFETLYYDYVDKNGLSEKIRSVNINSIINHFRNSKYVVFNRDSEFRYYGENAGNLWAKIKFFEYNDLVISAELIFKDYHELMDDLGIWNGYELFCLLKNTDTNHKYDMNMPDIQFRRIPIMIIGNGDEERQVKKLLKEVAPIDYSEFFELYEETYGVRKESAIANLGRYIEQYNIGGSFAVNAPFLHENDIMPFRELLNQKDFWLIDEVEHNFDIICSNSNPEALNPLTIKRLGYELHPGMIFNGKFEGVYAAITTTYFSSELVYLQDIPARISNLPSYKSILSRVKDSFDYVEIDNKVLASISYLEKEYGITKDFIRKYQETTYPIINDEYFNGESLWDILKSEPMTEYLKENKWLCTSLLRHQDGVFALVVRNAVILSKNRDNFSIADICKWFVDKNGKQSVIKLTDSINSMFGSTFDKYLIMQKLRERDMAKLLLTDNIDDYLDQLVENVEDSEMDFFDEEFY